MGCLGSAVTVNPDVAIFITMNPTYAGRSNLPGNLKQLFRPFAMTAPDAQLIVQVMLYSQGTFSPIHHPSVMRLTLPLGFQTAEHLSKKIVSLYRLCEEQLSRQSHYDFGLRALKAVLLSAGSSRRTHCAVRVTIFLATGCPFYTRSRVFYVSRELLEEASKTLSRKYWSLGFLRSFCFHLLSCEKLFQCLRNAEAETGGRGYPTF
jgi:hypothetical protein